MARNRIAGALKAFAARQVIDPRHPQLVTPMPGLVLRQQRIEALLEWVDWFNNRRLLEPIGNIPPVEGEQRYYATLDIVPLAA